MSAKAAAPGGSLGSAKVRSALARVGFARGLTREMTGHGFGYTALACNSLPGGSQLFVEHPHAVDYQLFVMFYWRDRVGWSISLYTEDKSIDCGDIARRMGSGGHQSAAG